MKKLVSVALLLSAVLIVPSLKAQDQLIWPRTQATQAPVRESFAPVLYRVSGKSADNNMYLFGSIHELTERNSVMPAAVLRAFDSASIAVYELPEDELDADPMVTFQKLVPHMYLPASDLLSNHLESAELQQLARAMPDFPTDALLRLRPWVADMFLELGDAKAAGMTAEFGVDLQLIKRGKQSGKKQIGLETLDEQVGYLSGDSMAVQVKRLKDNLAMRRNADENSISQTRKLLEHWIAGDVQGLERNFSAFRERDPALYAVLSTKRNRNWVAKLTPYLNERRTQTVFVTVGTLHLLGDDGLVRLLRNAGYKVERVTR